jgi:solute carrier family 25 phosphate transporter 3
MSQQQQTVVPAPAVAHPTPVFDLMYYVKSAVAGGLCCSVTHGAVCPIDVVK